MSPPEVWGITPADLCMEATESAVLLAFRDGVSHVVIRAAHRPMRWRCTLYERVLASGIGPDRLLLRLAPSDPVPPSGWSVHLATDTPRPPGVRPLVSAATHHLRSARSDVDRWLVSPFASPRSKSDDRPPLGGPGLRAFCQKGPPVIALGGIGPENAAEAIHAGAQGVAAISAIFLVPPAERRRLIQHLQACRTSAVRSTSG